MTLGDMPLDSQAHVRATWHLVTGMSYRRARAKVAGLPAPAFIPSEDELEIAMTMIQLAAEGLGMDRFPQVRWLS
jgi:hypothetical protein